jgi:asparagine synthase (glutamine-hydrolysing)
MCGIAGFVSRNAMGQDRALRVIQAMTDPLAHRGPDGDGMWVADCGLAAFGHRRLAIIDLSPAGRQPMLSADGRWVITYNGEIYNFGDLRAELETLGVRFRGHSDTEVILEGVARWGVEATVRRLNGIFAIGLWDIQEETLWLLRDHFGIKPLYWMQEEGGFAFGSELKALRAYPNWRPQIDVDALGSYFQFNYIPAPHSIYRNVRKLWPGGILMLRRNQAPQVSRYWDAYDVAGRPPAALSDQEALDGLDTLLRDSVRGQMISDVPLGGLLSGGIDSSMVVALMQAQSSRPVKTFSIGFHAQGFDEAPFASAVARHLGTEHHELYVDEGQALEAIPRLAQFYDEPFADSSQVPTYLVSRMARQHVTVALSGDGGDELFTGYTRYWRHDNVWRKTRALPRPLRAMAGAAIRAFDPAHLTQVMKLLPRRMKTNGGAATLLRLAAALPRDDPRHFHRSMLSFFEPGSRMVPAARRLDTGFDRELPPGLDYRQTMQLIDSCTQMIDDILVKVDRASMAVALEARVPLLDHRIYEYAWSLPARMKLRDGQSKWALRQVLERYVPRSLIDRPKAGFVIPVASWLRGELRDWCESLLDPRRLREDGHLNVALVRRMWREHLSGAFDHSDSLWAVLQFQSWLAQNEGAADLSAPT